MQVTKQLIARFFENNCTPAEVEAIIMYFTQHSRELEKYLGKEEWDAVTATGKLDPTIAESMQKEIWKQLFHCRRTPVISLFHVAKKQVAAACVIMVACTVLFMLESRTNLQSGSGINVKNRLTGKQPATPVSVTPEWHTTQNTTSHAQNICMEDGSRIILSPKSTVRYPVPFAHNKRTVLLEGEAFFDVVSNRNKPFTVFAGALSTTALGTSFTITSKKDSHNQIRVQLFTGKVVIASTKNIDNWTKDILLTAGQQLAYYGEKPMVSAIVRRQITKEIRVENKKGLSVTLPKQELSFSNSSLVDVLTDLSEFFHTNIQYAYADIQKINFTGNFTRTDDIKAVLKVITQMNGLELNETADGFTIIKPK